MKILLLGECSNLHWTLAQGLRRLGHDVTVASDGSRWMDNKRDIDLSRRGYNITDSFRYAWTIYTNLDKLKGYDIVQIKNPLFIDMRAESNLWLYKYLKRKNGKVFLGAFGTDHFWIKACLDKKIFRYSDYFIGTTATNIQMAGMLAEEWKRKEKIYLNQYIAETCDGIISCLYEYYESYRPFYSEKLSYIPIPIDTASLTFKQKGTKDEKVHFFIGIQSDRDQLKGTDVLLKSAKLIEKKYSDKVKINKAENIPNTEYLKLMAQSDVLLDQIYSYTPGMNALTAMAQGLIAVSGAEPEMYSLLGEEELKPIVNILPDETDIFQKLENIVRKREELFILSNMSRKFVEKYHNTDIVAQRYIDFWTKR